MILENLLEEASSLLIKVGYFISEEAKKFTSESIEVKSKNSLVSYVDKTAEDMLVEGLHQIFEEAGFITEEDTKDEIKEYNWIIDPLDGTTNFMHGIPTYAISVALEYKGEIVLGLVYELGKRELFKAFKNGGAYLNGRAIKVSGRDKMEDALVATGFPYYDYSQLEEFQSCLAYYMHHTRGVRRIGSAAVDLAYVACGRFDCFFEYGLNAWDVAAGALIVKEAGGVVSDYSGEEDYVYGRNILATSKVMSEEFLQVTKEYFKKK